MVITVIFLILFFYKEEIMKSNIIKKLLYRYEKSFFELSKSIEKDNIRTKIAFDRSFKSAREI